MADRLGFHIEKRGWHDVLVYSNDSCRVASSAEIAMWEALERDAAVLEAALALAHQVDPQLSGPFSNKAVSPDRLKAAADRVRELADSGEDNHVPN